MLLKSGYRNLALIKLPKVKSATDATIFRWLLEEGSAVKSGDLLFEFETEYGLAEAESALQGTLAKILCPAGQTAPINAPVAVIKEPGQSVDNEIDQAQAYLANLKESTIDTKQEQEQEMAANDSAPAPEAQKTAAPSAPVIPILMPQAGNSMEEGTIITWNVKVGDIVATGDILVEIETDKATMEMEATDAGRIARLVAAEGDIVAVKEPIAFIAESDQDVDAYIAASGGTAKEEPKAAAPAPAPKPAAAPPRPAASKPAPRPVATTTGGRVKASPAARKMAKNRGLDLGAVGTGSGPDGRILSTDVERIPAGASMAPVVVEPAQVVLGEPYHYEMTKMRRAIGKNLSFSKQNLPHWYIQLTIDADPMFKLYKQEKQRYAVSVNDVVVKACAVGLQEFPAFRTQISGNDMVEFPNSNIGVAVGTDAGLTVPVICGIEQMSLAQLGLESRRIVESARNGKVENQGKGVFSISNLGMFGVEAFSAIINPPEAAILAVGGIREEVIVKNGMMRPGRKMTMTLSMDHRVIDGYMAAQFFARLKELLEAPEQLL